MMRNLLSLALILFVVGMTNAQLTFSPGPVVEFEGAHSTHDIQGHFYITNGSTTDQEAVNWEIEVVDQPDGWDFQLCDLVLCYDYNTLKNNPNNPSVLNPTAETLWTWHTLPNGIEGIANYILHIRRASDGTELVDVPIQVTAILSDVEDINVEALNIFPNPTESMFQISNDEKVDKVSLYNIVGKEIASYNHNSGNQYDVSDLQKGLYLVRVMSNQDEILKVMRLNVR